jgi:hypothetical protein
VGVSIPEFSSFETSEFGKTKIKLHSYEVPLVYDCLYVFVSGVMKNRRPLFLYQKW